MIFNNKCIKIIDCNNSNNNNIILNKKILKI